MATTSIAIALATRRPHRVSADSVIGAGILIGLLAASVIVPAVSPYDAYAFSGPAHAPPSTEHPFGTDSFGRDVLVRVAESIRLDYLIAAVGVTASILIGTLLGLAAAGARRPIWGGILMRLTDAIIAIPFVLLVLLIVMSIGSTWAPLGLPPGVAALLVAVLATGWTIYARMAKSQAEVVLAQDYVVAARLMGYSRIRILFGQVLPNVIGHQLTYALSDGVMIIALAGGLAFLGAGVVPPTPELGSMMNEGTSVLASAWWITVFPAAVLLLTALGTALASHRMIGGRAR